MTLPRSPPRRTWARVLAKYRDPGLALNTYDHAPRGARLIAELARLLTLHDSPIRDQAMWYVNKLKGKFLLPRWYRFYPRDHVPSGGTPYDEDSVRREYFSSISTGNPQSPVITPARPASPASVRAAGSSRRSATPWGRPPTFTPVPSSRWKQISIRPTSGLTAYFLLDYRYQLSASLNPAFHGGVSATESSSVKLDHAARHRHPHP